MAGDKDFGKRIEALLKEHASYGVQHTPVQSANWPDTSVPNVEAPKDGTVVTNGETAPIDQPRSDLEQQANGGEPLDQECVGEIASLLLTIGYILQSKGLIDDKFNVETTISFLEDNFLSDDQGPVGGPDQIEPNSQVQDMLAKPKMANVVGTYMEQRKLLESRHKKNI
jgi:hypothetical protein